MKKYPVNLSDNVNKKLSELIHDQPESDRLYLIDSESNEYLPLEDIFEEIVDDFFVNTLIEVENLIVDEIHSYPNPPSLEE